MSEPEQIQKKYIIGIRQEEGKHFACVMLDETSEVVYVSPAMDTVEDAVRDARAQILLIHAEKGETIKMVELKSDQP